ncbi:hypothetical protein EYC84_001076 [Monilinia fructicola]|uniref:Uncharacterized protein n=1 Tax=Monilinia fructicola TaxID=38448 RepID=A0A5M9JJI3_MONFR|nr:hypothetical protein EYC84_001076 [Monilinia fructicola]
MKIQEERGLSNEDQMYENFLLTNKGNNQPFITTQPALQRAGGNDDSQPTNTIDPLPKNVTSVQPTNAWGPIPRFVTPYRTGQDRTAQYSANDHHVTELYRAGMVPVWTIATPAT